MMKMRKMLSAIVMLLCFFVVSPMFIEPTLIAQTRAQPELISVQIQEDMRTVQVFGKTIPTSLLVRIEKWTNGTKLHINFRHILNGDNSTQLLTVANGTKSPRQYFGPKPPPREVIVNYTKWITNTTTTSSETKTKTASPLGPTAWVYYPYRNWTDGLWFVLKGSYGNVFATFDHDDNYNRDGYYPLEENTPYHLSGLTRPYHIHLTKNLLDAWVVGNISEALAVAATFFVYECIEELILKGLEAASKTIAAILGSPVVVALLVIEDIVETIQKLLEILGFLNTAQWIENVIREHFLGDGWAWRGPIHKSWFIGWYWSPYLFKPMTGAGIYEVREFDQTWGSEGIFGPNPHHYTVCWHDRTEWKTAPTSAVIIDYKMGISPWPWN